MAYATIAELEDRLTARMLATRITEKGEDKERVLEAYIDMAGAVIDARLSSRYATPATSNALLNLICLNLAIWQIEADRGGGLASDKLPPSVQLPYEQANKWLDQLASGEMLLSSEESADGAGAGLSVKSAAPMFSASSDGMGLF